MAHPPYLLTCSARCQQREAGRRVLLADGTIGLGGDAQRVLRRAAQLPRRGGRCVAELDPTTTGAKASWVRLESGRTVEPWFRWASVGLDSAALVVQRAGLQVTDVQRIGQRAIVDLRAAA